MDWVLDGLCTCQLFETPVTHWKNKTADVCSSIEFSLKYKRIELAEFTCGQELCSKGLYGQAYYDIQHPGNLLIAFRHQEGEELWDSDLWEAMGLWGRNFMELSFPHYLAPDTIFSTIAMSLQYLIFYTRYYLQQDYFSNSSILVRAIKQWYRKHHPNTKLQLHFTGYSMGGAIAQLQARYQAGLSDVELANAIVFASNGIQDIEQKLYPHIQFSTKATLLNLVDSRDIIAKMDCQVAAVCSINTTYDKEIHEHFVYGSGAEEYLQAQKDHSLDSTKCLSSTTWNENYGAYCAPKGTTNDWINISIIVSAILMCVVLRWKWKKSIKLE